MKAEELEILEDEIIEIEEFDIIDTIDIEIDSRSRLFFANDILTHNSGMDATDLTLSNVSESSGLLHTVDGLFGLIADPLMKAKGEYYIKYIADRVSGMENTRKKFLFNRPYGRIEEDMNSQIEDMEFIAAGLTSFNKRNNSNVALPISSTQPTPIQSTISDNVNDLDKVKKGNELFNLG